MHRMVLGAYGNSMTQLRRGAAEACVLSLLQRQSATASNWRGLLLIAALLPAKEPFTRS